MGINRPDGAWMMNHYTTQWSHVGILISSWDFWGNSLIRAEIIKLVISGDNKWSAGLGWGLLNLHSQSSSLNKTLNLQKYRLHFLNHINIQHVSSQVNYSDITSSFSHNDHHSFKMMTKPAKIITSSLEAIACFCICSAIQCWHLYLSISLLFPSRLHYISTLVQIYGDIT